MLTSAVLKCIPTFHRSCGDRLTGDCRVFWAVGGEQRGATSPSSAQPRTATRDPVRLGSAADAARGTR